MAKISKYGIKMTTGSGIGQLMIDLGNALSERHDCFMLGGGNPAHIPEVQKSFHQSMTRILQSKIKFEQVFGSYDPPQGNKEFITAFANMLNKECGWHTKPKNIALTNGSQSAFFILFNLFSGAFEDGSNKKILLPLAPEYIGYCDVGFIDDLFIANKPKIQNISDHIFKYHIDFSRLYITDEIGAICVSRPTNPTGNVLTNPEIEKISGLASANNIPLIIDNAYGAPLPNIIFTDVKPIWDEHIIVCMSLSKLGLPAARTGIIIANEEIIEMVTQFNAVMSLAPGGIGPAIVTDLIRTGELLELGRNVIKPFYQKKADEAVEQLSKLLDGTDFHIHKPEGTFFLWLWLKDLPITDEQLYQRLKKRGVLVVPGHYFFPGLKESWQHKNECIRINYAMDKATVTKGLSIIADEVKRAYR